MNIHTQKAPRVNLTPNITKILAAICLVIQKAQENEFVVTQYDIVKTLFLADKKHLNTYGRPITYDNYCAMKHGPVPSVSYDLLKGNNRTLQKYGLQQLQWEKTPAPSINKTASVYRLKKGVKCNMDSLSESDCEALEHALMTVNGLTVSQLRKLTHGDFAYMEANPDEESGNFRMSLGLLFDVPDYEAAEQVEFFSKHQ